MKTKKIIAAMAIVMGCIVSLMGVADAYQRSATVSGTVSPGAVRSGVPVAIQADMSTPDGLWVVTLWIDGEYVQYSDALTSDGTLIDTSWWPFGTPDWPSLPRWPVELIAYGGSVNGSFTDVIDTTGLAEGSHTVSVQIGTSAEGMGDVGIWNFPDYNVGSFIVDNTAPIVSAGNDVLSSGLTKVSGIATDALSGVDPNSYSWSGEGIVGPTNQNTVTVDVTYQFSETITLNVSDLAGNTGSDDVKVSDVLAAIDDRLNDLINDLPPGLRMIDRNNDGK